MVQFVHEESKGLLVHHAKGSGFGIMNQQKLQLIGNLF